MNEEEPFLKRWSRRKAEAKAGADAAGPAAAPEADIEARSEPDTPKAPQSGGMPADQRELTEADFADVDFEALDYNSDYSRFTAPGVPESVRSKALQKLWTSNPIFTAADPFQDYQADYTDAAVAVPMGTLKTAYRIGKGFLSDDEVAEWEKLGQPAEVETAAKPSSAGVGAVVGAGGTAATVEPGPPAVVVVAAEPADQPEVHALLRQSDAYHAELYPAESNHLIDVATLAEPNVRFLVARRSGAVVGCGALVLGNDGEAELKRMFVMPEARGLKIGSRILEALEAAGKAEGVRVICLETGVRQPESLALYCRHGFTERGPFGSYEKDPLSRYLEKWIA